MDRHAADDLPRSWALDSLTDAQRGLLDRWLPGARILRDHGWGLVATTVLEAEHDGRRLIVKAGGPDDHHIAREITGHLRWTTPWTRVGRAPVLLHHDAAAKLLVTRYLEGSLAQGTTAELDPQVHRQAGGLLALLHHQSGVEDAGWERAQQARALSWLDRPHRIDPATAQRLRAIVRAWPTPTVRLVPTHGDWQPRNWLVHDGQVRVIDLGRAALRPAWTDLARLSAQQWLVEPRLEAACLDGYGSDPREPDAWQRNRIREAIGTAVWARQVGDEPFEQQGHRMIAQALADQP